MTDHDLATLVREHVQHDEPPFLMSSDTVVALGRRTLLRRRARRGFAALAVGAVAAVTVPMVFNGASAPAGDNGRIDPATAAALAHYDAQRMPRLIDEHARAVLSQSVDDLGPATFRAGDSQGNKLTWRDYDKASNMSVSYGARTSAHSFRVALMHSGSEAEGDARKVCAQDLADGYAFTCEVTTSTAGDAVVTRVTAARPARHVHGAGWSAVTEEQLRTGVPAAGDPDQRPIDPNDVYFFRSVESVHSKTFLTVAQEVVKAPSFEGAQQAFEVPADDLARITVDPELVIPEPLRGQDGCAWTVPDSTVHCASDPGTHDCASTIDELQRQADKRDRFSRESQLSDCVGTRVPAPGE